MAYIEEYYGQERRHEDQYSLFDHLLKADNSYDGGVVEYTREQVDHLRECLARFLAYQNLTTDDINTIFSVTVRIEEDDDT